LKKWSFYKIFSHIVFCLRFNCFSAPQNSQNTIMTLVHLKQNLWQRVRVHLVHGYNILCISRRTCVWFYGIKLSLIVLINTQWNIKTLMFSRMTGTFSCAVMLSRFRLLIPLTYYVNPFAEVIWYLSNFITILSLKKIIWTINIMIYNFKKTIFFCLKYFYNATNDGILWRNSMQLNFEKEISVHLFKHLYFYNGVLIFRVIFHGWFA